jgi:hypothetical protein
MGQYISQQLPQPGNLVGPIGTNRYGWRIFQFLDPQDGQWHHVVMLPDGRILYSDAAGDIGHGPDGIGRAGVGAVIGVALGGLALGPVGAILAGVLGAAIGDRMEHQGRS